MSDNELTWLDDVMHKYYDEVRLRDTDRCEIDDLIYGVHQAIKTEFPDARLNTFGSFASGFGTINSDVDICLRLSEDEEPINIHRRYVLKRVSKALSSHKFPNYVVGGARVPIVKCDASLYRKGQEIDIAYYNTLALYNTQLLAKYCEWEPERLPKLGIWVKKWAKEYKINDAFASFPSPYAWMIVLIYYLQRCSPPVLPFLQQNETIRSSSVHLGSDVGFEGKVQKGWSQNTNSVAQLFVGFLHFLKFFSRKNTIIQIRTKKPLLKSEKQWIAPLSIEDPFDLDHNLGGRTNKGVIKVIMDAVDGSRRLILSGKPPFSSQIVHPPPPSPSPPYSNPSNEEEVGQIWNKFLQKLPNLSISTESQENNISFFPEEVEPKNEPSRGTITGSNLNKPVWSNMIKERGPKQKEHRNNEDEFPILSK